MSDTRLSLALTQGLLPEWADTTRVVWFGMPTPESAQDLAFGTVTAIQPLQPVAGHLAEAGIAVHPVLSMGHTADLAIVTLPRARARAQMWIAEAAASLPTGGWLLVDGAKTDGVDSLFKACRARLDSADSFTKAHGRLFWGQVGADRFDDWRAPDLRAGDFVTGPGVFSADGIDPASELLAQALPVLKGRVADLGAGWGYLARQILQNDGVTHLDLVEADHIALSAARQNITDPRASFHWADATAWQPEAPLDAVVMNPPFHTGRSGDPGLGRAFIAAAARALAPHGKLWLVANRHLPYEAELDLRFSAVHVLDGTRSFKLLRAEKPRRTGKKGRS
ncbi:MULTISPECIES: class I SAM-dependent methyltransferase [unclassified Meridianimarinicoccus]|uniref:class I SAM-dependent methyltransferase n=1 Tax=unclassified Meridianimarinicoccus TaxID=2923344 RepID=UPI001867A918|nr:methyltransferase [Fluviibacterium sp. MJW13]